MPSPTDYADAIRHAGAICPDPAAIEALAAMVRDISRYAEPDRLTLARAGNRVEGPVRRIAFGRLRIALRPVPKRRPKGDTDDGVRQRVR